jgi:hypothetical protein
MNNDLRSSLLGFFLLFIIVWLSMFFPTIINKIQVFEIVKIVLEFILFPIFVIISYDFLTFRRYWINLCREIDENHKRIEYEEIEKQVLRMEEEFKKRIGGNPRAWVGFEKNISIWKIVLNISEMRVRPYRYFLNTEITTFIQKGYYHFVKKYEEDLTNFYFFCESAGVDTQLTEVKFDDYLKGKHPEIPSTTIEEKTAFLNNIIQVIKFQFNQYRPLINERYQNIHIYFKKDFSHILNIYLKDLLGF